MPTLNWLTRDKDILRAHGVPYRLLEPMPRLSAGDTQTGNMLIQGDNLEALKALLPFHAGRVKCIYIDPPFNTKQAFEHYDDNLEHSIWLGMMYPRLELLHQMLAEDGTIVVHLDDEELAYAIVMLDEIFGRRNRLPLCTFKQSSVSGPKAINPGVVSISSYLFCYAKDRSRWKSYRAYRPRGRDVRYTKFIENRHTATVERWSITSLSSALEAHFGAPVRELKSQHGAQYEDRVTEFVVEHRASVIQPATIREKDVSETARAALRASANTADRVFEAKRDGQVSQYFLNGKQVIFYESKVQEIDGQLSTAERVSDLWDDLLSNNLHKEGEVAFPKGKKPEALIRRVLDLYTRPGDLVLDAFLGSGTTAAVAHKLDRPYIGIETGEQAVTHCAERLRRVIEGEQSGISRAVGWSGGGGFHFYRLGSPVYDEQGHIRSDIGFTALAGHVWFSETGGPWDGTHLGPVLGIRDGRAYALLYNGVLGDLRTAGGNVLTRATLAFVRERIEELEPDFDGPLTVYAERSTLSETTCDRARVSFKQMPYDVRTRR